MQSTTVLASRKQTVIDMFVSEYGKIKTSELLSLFNYANCIKTKLAIVSPTDQDECTGVRCSFKCHILIFSLQGKKKVCLLFDFKKAMIFFFLRGSAKIFSFSIKEKYKENVAMPEFC